MNKIRKPTIKVKIKSNKKKPKLIKKIIYKKPDKKRKNKKKPKITKNKINIFNKDPIQIDINENIDINNDRNIMLSEITENENSNYVSKYVNIEDITLDNILFNKERAIKLSKQDIIIKLMDFSKVLQSFKNTFEDYKTNLSILYSLNIYERIAENKTLTSKFREDFKLFQTQSNRYISISVSKLIFTYYKLLITNINNTINTYWNSLNSIIDSSFDDKTITLINTLDIIDLDLVKIIKLIINY